MLLVLHCNNNVSHTSGSSATSRRNVRVSPSCSIWTVHATNARWFGEVQASVAKCTRPGCSYQIVNSRNTQDNMNLLTLSNLEIRSRHFSNNPLISREMVWLEGRSTLGRPAVRRSRNSRSLMILTGLLFSVIHLTRCALYRGLSTVL